MRDADYFSEHPDEFELLTDAEKEAVFNGESLNGETTDVSEPATNEEAGTAPEAGTDDKDEAEPEILTRDGKYTIPYSELQTARDEAAQLKAIAAQQAELIRQLQEAQKQDAETGGTEAQDKVLESLDPDGIYTAAELKPYIQSLIDQQAKAMQAEFAKVLTPMQQALVQTEAERHMNAIRAIHPDVDEIVKGATLTDWVNSKPSFVRDAYNAVIANGTAEQVNELLTALKNETGVKLPVADPVKDLEAEKAKAQEAIAKVKKPMPTSLSDIPASTAGTLDETEQYRSMTPRQLEKAFHGKSPEQIHELMAKLV